MGGSHSPANRELGRPGQDPSFPGPLTMSILRSARSAGFLMRLRKQGRWSVGQNHPLRPGTEDAEGGPHPYQTDPPAAGQANCPFTKPSCRYGQWLKGSGAQSPPWSQELTPTCPGPCEGPPALPSPTTAEAASHMEPWLLFPAPVPPFLSTPQNSWELVSRGGHSVSLTIYLQTPGSRR